MLMGMFVLAVQMYPEPNEQAKKLGLFGLAGALANTIALVFAGVFMLASWRWYFRFITIIIAPFATLAWFSMPKTSAVAEDLPGAEKWKRMDLGGVFILLAGLILFILGFTQAPNTGWKSSLFIAPLVVSIVLLMSFFVWERFMKRGYSLLPHNIWTYPNIFPLMLQASAVFMWFACAQLRIATYFQDALGDSPILAAVKSSHGYCSSFRRGCHSGRSPAYYPSAIRSTHRVLVVLCWELVIRLQRRRWR